MNKITASQISFFYLLTTICFSLSLEAASPTKNKKLSQSNPRLSQFKMALKLPYANRMQVIRSWPKNQVEKKLGFIIFNDKLSLRTRWKALTALGAIRPNSTLIQKALESKEWFLRNSALISLKSASREKALKWAKKLLFDPALVVRTSAVDVIRYHKGVEARKDLIKALSSPQNFRRGKGLWVREHINEALNEFEKL